MSSNLSLRSAVRLALATGYGKPKSSSIRRAAQCALLTGAAAAAVQPQLAGRHGPAEQRRIEELRVGAHDHALHPGVAQLRGDRIQEAPLLRVAQEALVEIGRAHV